MSQRMGMRQLAALRQTQKTQTLHNALWSIYIPAKHDGRGKYGLDNGLQPPDLALRNLDDFGREQVDDPLLGVVLWKLVDDDPPEPFRTLLHEVLLLGVEQARDMREESRMRREEVPVFPPYRDGRALESKFAIFDKDHGVAKATVDLCVRTHFPRLLDIVEPENWPDKCSIFWDPPAARSRREAGKEEKRGGEFVDARLCLPGHRERTPLPIRLKVKRTDGTLDAHTEFRMVDPNEDMKPYMDHYRGSIDVSKEQGRIEVTRIRQEREVRFAAEHLREFQKETLCYWLQAETACFALH